LGERKSCITAAMIRNLLEHHGLSKKKRRLPGDPMSD